MMCDCFLQQSIRRQGVLAFSLFGVLLAHGDLRNNKLSQLSVNLWNLSHKHGYCETRMSVGSHAHTHTLIIQDSVSLGRTAGLTPPPPPFLLQVRTLECIKHQAQQHDMSHLADVAQRLALQSRT